MTYFLAHPFLFLAAGFTVATLALAWFVVGLYRRWNRTFGAQGGNREALGEALERIREAEQRLGGLEPRVNALEGIGKIAVQKVGFLRFNPFAETGGNQSFAVALLDRNADGVVISSLYTREGVRVYAKKVEHGTSKHPLSAEEETVLREALTK